MRGVGYDKVAASLDAVGWGFLILVSFGFLSVVIEGLALRCATGPSASFGRIVGASLASAAVNSLTPFGEGGEVIRINLLASTMPGKQALSSVMFWNLAYRVTKHVAIFLGPLALFLFDPDRFGIGMLLGFTAAAVVATVPSLLFLLLLRKGGAAVVVRLLGRIPVVRKRITPDLLEKARETDALVHEFASSRRRDAWLAMALLFAARLLTFLDVWVTLTLLGAGTTFPEAMFLVTGLQVVRIVLSVLPVQIGVGEGGETSVFMILGLTAELGFSQAFVRLLRLLILYVMGLGYLAREAVVGRRARQHAGAGVSSAAVPSAAPSAAPVAAPVTPPDPPA